MLRALCNYGWAHSASSSLFELAQPFNESCCVERRRKNKVPETRADKKGLLNCQLRVGPFTPWPLDTETGISGPLTRECYASQHPSLSWPRHNLHPDPETAGVYDVMYRVMPRILTWSPLLYPASRKLSQCPPLLPQLMWCRVSKCFLIRSPQLCTLHCVM